VESQQMGAVHGGNRKISVQMFFFVQHTKYEVVELEASDFTYSKMQLYVHEPSDQDPTDTFDPEFEVTI
jgi:hypothetical protein